jgi:hypothetical protein
MREALAAASKGGLRDARGCCWEQKSALRDGERGRGHSVRLSPSVTCARTGGRTGEMKPITDAGASSTACLGLLTGDVWNVKGLGGERRGVGGGEGASGADRGGAAGMAWGAAGRSGEASGEAVGC